MSGPAFRIAPDPDPDLAEAGRRLFAGSCEFHKGVVAMDGLPSADRAEICFAGRSNVGKSSLINALTGRKALARASGTPGRTQEINFFDIGGRMWLVDLPGYGFAKAPPKVVARWQALLKDYLAGRPNLRRVFLLVDGRHGVKAPDREIMDLLKRAAVTFQCVLTKTDKMGAGPMAKVAEGVAAELAKWPVAYPDILLTSAETGAGIHALRAEAASLLER